MKIKTERVAFDMAAPAKWHQVALWLITNGRRGKLFISKREEFNKFIAPTSINCRSVMAPVIKGAE